MKISLRWGAHSVAAAKIVPLLVPGTACLSLAAPTRAQESDSIYGCDHKDFDAVSMQTAKDGTETVVEGEVNILNYGLPLDAGELAVYRNVRTALAGAGYGFLFEQSPSTLVARKGSQFIQVQTGGGAYTLNMVKQQAMEQVVTADPTLQQVLKLMQQTHCSKCEWRATPTTSASETSIKRCLKRGRWRWLIDSPLRALPTANH